MSSVDDRIVNMQFNNRQFSAGVTDSQRSLATLEQSLARAGSGTAGGLSSMAGAVEETTSRFGALKIAGISAIATIASKATTMGLGLLKSLTLDPITQGFTEYTTNLNSIQTIMANTGASVDKTNHFLQLLNQYSDKTIYNFSQMASAIGKFTAAGVNLPDATDAIRGMANSAALSGASVEQLNSAMYQMSQALAAGTIKLMDWNSLVNANMGGENMQKSLKATALTMDDGGRAMTDATTAAGNFRDSLQAGWLTADIFTKTMKVMGGQTVPQGQKALKLLDMTQKEFNKSGLQAGDIVAFTTDQLQKMGYSKAAAERLHELSDQAIHSAQDIKSIPQLIDVVRESIGSGFAKIFQDLFGDFEESKAMWTSVGTAITGVIGNIFGQVDQMLLGWRKLGGYQELWAGFGNIFQALGNLIHPFIVAFQAITPGAGKAGQTMFTLTHAFFLFTEMLVKVTEGVDYLSPLFEEFGMIIGLVFRQFSGLSAAAGPLSQIFDRLGASMGNMAQQGIQIANSLLEGIISGLSGSSIQAAITSFAMNIIAWIKGALGIHSPSTEMVVVGFNIAEGIAEGLIKGVSAIVGAFGTVLKVIFDGVGTLFAGFDAMDFASLFNAILTGSLLLTTKKVMQFVDTWRGFGNNFQAIFDQLGNSMKAWQQSLKSKMILEIAFAIAILAASIIALSLVDPKKLATGIGALAAVMALMTAMLFALTKMDLAGGLIAASTSILILSVALTALAGAVALFGNMDLMTLGKGIGAIAVVLGILVGAMLGFSKIQGSIQGMAASMLILSIALNVMAAAVLAFGSMDMGTLAKGLGGIAVGLGLLVGAMLALDKIKGNVDGLAASILIMSAAMVVLSVAVAAFGNMSIETLAQGFAALAVGLGLMVGALILMSKNVAGVAASAASMVLMATAMNMLVGVILLLGTAPWPVVARGLTFLAIALGIFLAAAAVASIAPVAAGLEILGTSILLFGAGLFLAGTGMAAFATGFALMAATGTAGIAVMIAAIHAFLAILPAIATQVAAAFIAFIQVIANATGPIRSAFDKIFANMIGVITDNIPVIGHMISRLLTEIVRIVVRAIPQYGKVFSTLIETGLKVLTKAVPQYIRAGTTIILRVLEGMAKNVPRIVNTAGDLIVGFLNAVGNQLPRIADAGARLIVRFIQGLADAINNNADDLRRAGLDLAMAILNGMTGGLLNRGMDMVRNAAEQLASALPGWMRKVLGIESPSKVMIPIGEAVAAGVGAGVAKGTKGVLAAVTAMANSLVAAGNRAVLKAQRGARKIQNRAFRAAALADIKADEARDAARFARQHKKDKDAQKRAKRLQKEADASQKRADQVQAAADRAAQHVQTVRTFQDADLHGKGDIRNDAAVRLAERANQTMQKANAEAERGRELMKTNHKAGRALLKQAERDAKRARALAKEARAAHKEANQFFAREVEDRIRRLERDAAADEKAKRDQEKYDAADAQGKSDILTKRAEASEARAKEQKALAEKLMRQARRLAHSDAAKAMKLLDRAEKASEAAKAAADQAAQERDQAEQVLNEGTTGADTGTGATIEPSRSVLEDAAKAVDRYTQSLLFASQSAAAAEGTIQFTQNNYSPEALSASEVYRQSKNLLSSAELKMGVRTTT